MDRAAFFSALRSRANSLFGTSLSQVRPTLPRVYQAD